jgi:predicted DNA-binding transcriptional regulator YafY
MPEFGPEPSAEGLDREREVRRETLDARQRVREVLLSLHEPTTVAGIADRADCSETTARKHLADLADLGVARVETTDGTTRYRRNEEYLRWRRANRLVEEFDADALLDRVEELEARDEAFAAEFGVESPDAVPIPDDADHATVEARWDAARDWAAVRDELSVTREALRMVRRTLSSNTVNA